MSAKKYAEVYFFIHKYILILNIILNIEKSSN